MGIVSFIRSLADKFASFFHGEYVCQSAEGIDSFLVLIVSNWLVLT